MITVKKSDFDRHVTPDQYPDASYLDQEGFEQRRAAYQRDDFAFVGVSAAIEVAIPYGNGAIMHLFESPGIWGVESDSGEEHLNSLFAEEREVLAAMLTALGVKVEG